MNAVICTYILTVMVGGEMFSKPKQIQGEVMQRIGDYVLVQFNFEPDELNHSLKFVNENECNYIKEKK